jgi:hypothetical protein
MSLAAIIMTIVASIAIFSVMENLNEQFEQDPEANAESVSLMVMLSTVFIYFLSNMASIMLYKLLLE